MKLYRCSLAVLVLVTLACAQEPEPNKKPKADAYQKMMKLFAENGITMDVKKGTVTLECVTGHRDQALEFLLVHQKGKTHETLFITAAKASILNAALLAIGLEVGKNARVVQKDPLPTLEEVRAGARVVDVFAPEGRPVYLTASWTPEKGKKTEVSISDLIFNAATEKPVTGEFWVFLGGKMAPLYRGEAPVFLGDYQGNLVSIVYKQPSSHLITMSHELASDEQVWWFSKLCPTAGTEVRLTFHKEKPAVVAAREARILKEEADAKKAAGAKKDK